MNVTSTFDWVAVDYRMYTFPLWPKAFSC